MSHQDISNIEFQKNALFRDKYRKLMKWIVTLLISAGILLTVFIYQSVKPQDVRYFGSTTTGEQIPLNGLDDPVITQKLITQWASIATKNIYTIDFNKFQSQLDNMKVYFTDAGWSSFYDALNQSQLLGMIKKNKQEMTGVITNDPVVQKTGIERGVRYWIVQMPILISLDSSSGGLNRHVVVTMTIVRSKNIHAPSGLQIERIATMNGDA